jgi:putative ATP-dependent endonuclease of the OLD family
VFLHALDVENFRGVRRARLTFDETTVLIGENDCGKSSLLEALALVLGTAGEAAPPFVDEHFHRERDGDIPGPIRVGLDFRERSPGEWDAEALGALGSLAGAGSSRPRRLELRLVADPNGGGVHWTVDVSGGRRRRSEDDPAHLAAVRRLNPILWLKGGALVGSDVGASGDSVGKAALFRELESSFEAVMAGRDSDRQLEAGYRVASEILAKRRIGAAGAPGSFRPVIAELVGGRGVEIRKRRDRPGDGSGARKLGTLILATALLRAAPAGGVGGGDPILVVEDPEAHLHPMTLASVWGLLERIPAQKIVTTQSGTLLQGARLQDVRRLTRSDGVVREWSVHEHLLSREDLRKVSYHLRMKRGTATFARCWLLVEGETEFWMLPELARLVGYDFALEGVACVEFAQCGLPPLIKVANALGIEWHVLADGDEAGMRYAEVAAARARRGERATRVTMLEDRDIEHCFWRHGFSGAILRAAGQANEPTRRLDAKRVIDEATRRRSKPGLALDLVLAAAEEGAPDVPMPIRWVIEMCVRLARHGDGRGRPAAARRRN